MSMIWRIQFGRYAVVLLCWVGGVNVFAQINAPEVENKPVASLGEVKLSRAEILDALDGLSPVEKEAVSRDVSLLQQWVRTFLVQRRVLHEALARQWENEPQIKALLERTRESALVDSYLEAQGQREQANPSEEELHRAYEQKKAAFFVPRSYLLAQIFIAVPHDKGAADLAARQKLAAVQAALKAQGSDFSAIARAKSEDTASSAQGGGLGWLTDSQFQPEIRAKLPEMKLHVVSDSILLADGWHIFRVQDIREAHTLTYEQARATLTVELQAEAVQNRVQAYVAKLLQEQAPQIDENSLAKLQAHLRP